MSYRSFIAVAALAGAAGLSACDNKVTGPDEPEVAAMRLTIAGQQTVTVRSSGTSGTVQLVQGQAATITAVFLDASDQVIEEIQAAEFRLDVTPSAGITFARTGAFAGTLTAASGTTTGSLQVSLFHIPANHTEFGPLTVNVIASSQ